jgi:hypothetical protein
MLSGARRVVAHPPLTAPQARSPLRISASTQMQQTGFALGQSCAVKLNPGFFPGRWDWTVERRLRAIGAPDVTNILQTRDAGPFPIATHGWSTRRLRIQREIYARL